MASQTGGGQAATTQARLRPNQRLVRGMRVRSRRNPTRQGSYLGLVGTFAVVQWDDRVGSTPRAYLAMWGNAGVPEGRSTTDARHYLRTWSTATRADLEELV